MKSIHSHIAKKFISNMLSKNLGIDEESILRGMKAWAQGLENSGRITKDWCIRDGKLIFLCNANLNGVTLEYPISIVAGTFLYDGPKSDFYPEYIANIKNYHQYPPVSH